jgi:hypothetical protein
MILSYPRNFNGSECLMPKPYPTFRVSLPRTFGTTILPAVDYHLLVHNSSHLLKSNRVSTKHSMYQLQGHSWPTKKQLPLGKWLVITVGPVPSTGTPINTLRAQILSLLKRDVCPPMSRCDRKLLSFNCIALRLKEYTLSFLRWDILFLGKDNTFPAYRDLIDFDSENLDLAIFLSLKASIEVMDMPRFSCLLVSYSLDPAAGARCQHTGTEQFFSRRFVLSVPITFLDLFQCWICFSALA